MRLLIKTIFILFLYFIISCKKDKKDTIPPTISITSPTIGQAYKMFDTIAVNAHVSDNEHLSSVSVTITDMNHVPQQGNINASIPSADFILTMNYMLTQFHLQSGNYYLQIAASDGYNITTAYQQIYITASPAQLWGYCVVLKSNTQLIKEYDTSLSPNNFYAISLNQPYNGMKYGGYNEQLYVNGNGTQMSFQSYNMQQEATGSLNYSESATAGQQNYTCLYTDGNKPYVGFYNGNIYSYQNTSLPSTSYRYSPATAAYPYYFTTTTSYGVAAFRNTFGSSNDQIVAFTLASGAVIPSFPVALAVNTTLNSIVAMFEKANDSLYVLGNDASNNAVAYLFCPTTSAFMPISMPFGKLLSATKVNNGGFIYSTANGVYACNGLTVNPVSLLSNGAQKVTYQPGLNMLTVANSTSTMGNIAAYTVGTNSLTNIVSRSLALGDSIIDFEVITNK